MKEKYERPETQVNEFSTVDVITTSGGEPITNPGDDTTTGWPFG